MALQEELKAKHNGHSPGSEEEAEQSSDPSSAPFKVGKFFVPTEITDIIGKDWAIVNEHKHLLILPASVTINDLIEEFGKVYRKKKIVGLGVFDQFTGGLKRALDANIGRSLLYRFERIQLQKTMEANPGVPLSEVYPPVILLRYLCTNPCCISVMFILSLVKLPHHLDDTGVGKSAQIFTTTKKLVEALMKFIVDFRKDFFPNNLYFEADDQYLAQFEEFN